MRANSFTIDADGSGWTGLLRIRAPIPLGDSTSFRVIRRSSGVDRVIARQRRYETAKRHRHRRYIRYTVADPGRSRRFIDRKPRDASATTIPSRGPTERRWRSTSGRGNSSRSVSSGQPPALIGVAFSSPALDATVEAIRTAGGPIGDPKPAVQGGRIASVWSGHVDWGVAIMEPPARQTTVR